MGAAASIDVVQDQGERSRAEMLEKAVSNFVTKRVEIVGQEIEEKLVSQTTTQREYAMRRKSFEDGRKQFMSEAHLHNKSVIALALRHRSKMLIRYISQDALSASFVQKEQDSKQQTGEDVDKTIDKKPKRLGNAACADPKSAGPRIPKLHLQVNMGVQADDEDWIQVDDGDEIGETPRKPRESLLLTTNYLWESYRFTQSGTIFVKGFQEGIGQAGIRTVQRQSSMAVMPMRERLVLLGKLGQGATGIVYKALDLQDLRIVALKTIPVLDKSKRRQMVHELGALYETLSKREVCAEQALTSTNERVPDPMGIEYIVEFYDAFSNVEDASVALMVEYMDGGSLQDIVDNGGCSDEQTLSIISRQALQGLSFLHESKQLHRDLKPANMLINRQGDVKISDLGIVRQMEAETTDTSVPPQQSNSSESENMGATDGNTKPPLDRAHTFVGTITYMSPERIDGQAYTYSADIWSMGLAILTCALGRLPIKTRGGYWSILHCIRDDDPPALPTEGWSEEFQNFIAQMLNKCPDQRPSCRQILNHPFLLKNAGGAPRPSTSREEPDSTTPSPTEESLSMDKILQDDNLGIERRASDFEALLQATAEHLVDLRSRGLGKHVDYRSAHIPSHPLMKAGEAPDFTKALRVQDRRRGIPVATATESTGAGTESSDCMAQTPAKVREFAQATATCTASERLQTLADQLSLLVETAVERFKEWLTSYREEELKEFRKPAHLARSRHV